MVDWADEMGVESVVIDEHTELRTFKRELALGNAIYR
jgi:L-arabinose isomerase